MTRESKDSNATWRNPGDSSWDDPVEEEEIDPFSYAQDEVTTSSHPSRPALLQDELEEDEVIEPPQEPFLTRFEGLRQFGQQISPVLVPILFGGLTFLFILPLALGAHFYLRAEHLWPIALVLLALAVLQGMVLYYAGSNNVYWSLGIVGGFLLFLLVGCFAVFGPVPTAVLFIVLLIVTLVAARLYMRPVPEGSVYIVYSFGKYSRTFYPGLNFLLPWEWVDVHLHTREKQWTCPEQAVQVSRDEDVHLKATISYQLMPEDAYLAVSHVQNWEESLHQLFISLLQSVCSQLNPDDFIIWPQRSRHGPKMILNNPVAEDEAHWERINSILFQHIRDRVAQWGVLINWVSIRDITLTPRSSIAYDTGPVTVSGARPGNMGTATASNQPVQEQSSPQRMETAAAGKFETPPPVQPVHPAAPVPPAAPFAARPPEGAPAAPTNKIPKEEVLKNAYEQIKSGKITSPEAIRRIAASFQAIANDPEASKNVSFDPALAAQTLYERANLYEEQAMMAASYGDDSPTQTDWSYRGG